jgi:NAD(P)-dependent dehydrogenase (short-subunit alcohol dehydrogenase family)
MSFDAIMIIFVINKVDRGRRPTRDTMKALLRRQPVNVAGSTALVTGANRGLGRHLAIELLRRGATVYTGARNPEKIDLPGARPIALDVTDAESVAAAARIAGDVTLLVNNAGSSTGSDLLHGDLDRIRLEIDTHYLGTLSVIRAFAPRIAANGGGTILNILSVLSWLSLPQAGAYCAAKAAAWSMTNALRQQLAEQNIRVIGLHVGYMDTDMTAGLSVPKVNPADVARVAVDGIAQGAYEILADDVARQVQAGLAGGVAALYPRLASVN